VQGYYVDTVGKNKAKIAEYIRRQLKEDEMNTQMLPFDKSVWDSNKRKK
jgi:putative transposase